ncbi:kinase-like domain-containing protein [Schizophyllum amplum]|uniref:non-specific serine/threonine protein kinase n=1 Tax=Schizophyllum amplum TaxID=97359 RepID=A0A550C0H6_9AGAR|nr:kinase-like domain-containing protein [Auriculariopsis ampla]
MLYTQSEDVMEDPEYEEDDNEQMNVPTRSAPKSGSALNATTSLPSVDESSTHLARASQVKPTGLAAAIFGRYWDFVSQAILTVVMCWLVIAVTLNGIAIIFDPEHREYLLRTHWHATPRAPAQSLRRRSLASPLPSPPTSLHQQVDFIDCDPGVLSPDRYYRECPQDEASLDDSDSATQYFTPAVSSANLSSSTRSYEHLTSSQEPNESVYSHSFPPSHGIKACPRQTSVDLATANALFAWGFKFDGKLGQGSGGNVYSAHCRYSNRIFAVKTIRNTSYQSEYPEDCLHWLLTESRILKRIRFSAVDQHPFVVKQQYDFQKEQYIYSIMDRHVCDLHDIVEVVKKSGEHFPRSLLRFFVAEICAGVAGLHAVGIMHRDIKPANVLLARDGHIVLSDFNLAVEVDQDPNMPQVSFGYRQSKCGQTVTPILAIGPVTAGTPHFMAPEIVLGWKYGFAADWWSVGALMWMLWSGKLPYQEQIEESYPPLQGNTTWRQREAWQLKCSQELDRLTVREAPRVPRDMEECDSAFMTGLMEHNAALRLDGHAVKHHKFIKLTYVVQ